MGRAGSFGGELGNTPSLAKGNSVIPWNQGGQSPGRNEEHIPKAGAGRDRRGPIRIGPGSFTSVGVDGINPRFGLEGYEGFPTLAGSREKVGSCPIGTFGPDEFPTVGAVLRIDTQGKGLAVIFNLCDQGFASYQEAGGHSQTVACVGVIVGQPAKPLEVAVEIKANEVITGKEGVDKLSV